MSKAEKMIDSVLQGSSPRDALNERMKSMTYGQLPSKSEFEKAFDKEVDGDTYSFGRDPRVGTDKLTSRELWKELQDAVSEWEDGDDEAGDWASAVLGTLGFEWI
jgi:hypothetical protein